MGRSPCCDKTKVKRGPWSPEEDNTLKNYLHKHGTAGSWISLPQKAGLKRCGKSCRLRWLNYLRPNIKHGGFTEEEDSIILAFYQNIGSRWSVIASQLPGRTDNDVKNYWNTKLKKKLSAAAASTAAATSSFVRNSEFDNYEEILCGSRVQLPRLIHAPEIENARNIPFSAAINTNGSIINGLCGDEEAFGVEFNSGFMPFGNLNDLEKFDNQISNLSFGFWSAEQEQTMYQSFTH